MPNRGLRRSVTESKAKKRNKVFGSICGYPPSKLGRSKKVSPFDCGRPGCRTCGKDKKGNVGKTKNQCSTELEDE